jgi:hypothetical protein
VSIKSYQLASLCAVSSIAILLAAASSAASAGHNRHDNCNGNCGSATPRPPLHGAGSSDKPIVRPPLHGPGTSHNPIVKSGGTKRHCIQRGTVVHDHRNGKDCSYTAGNSRSYSRYLQCEGIHHGGHTPWC